MSIFDPQIKPEGECVLNDNIVKYVFCRNIHGHESGIRFPEFYRRRRQARKAARARWQRDFERFICRMQIIVLRTIIKRMEATK